MAKAKIGARYAQVIENLCHWIFSSEELPEWAEDSFLVVDITHMPDVSVRDIWDGSKFTKPPEVKIIEPKLDEGPVVISGIKLFDSFNEEEQLRIVEAAMVNAKVKLWYDKVMSYKSIRVSNDASNLRLRTLVDEGVIALNRVEELERSLSW